MASFLDTLAAEHGNGVEEQVAHYLELLRKAVRKANHLGNTQCDATHLWPSTPGERTAFMKAYKMLSEDDGVGVSKSYLGPAYARHGEHYALILSWNVS